jgi:hypothetical protein
MQLDLSTIVPKEIRHDKKNSDGAVQSDYIQTV